MAIGRFLGLARTEYACRHGLGNVFSAKGDHGAAREQYRQAAELARETGDRRVEGRMLSKLGLALTRTGANTEAQERFARAEALLSTVSDPMSLVELYCRWAEAALVTGNTAMVAELVGRAEEAALAVASPRPDPLEAMLRNARALLSTGRK